MKSNKLIYFSALFIIFSLTSLKYDNKNNTKFISIETLNKKGSLKIIIKGLGGYQEECVEFDLQNNTSDTLFIEIEPGRRLISKDTSIQDILIVKRKRFKLFPRIRKKIKGFGFCCQSDNHAPYKDAIFNIGYLAPTDWINLAEVINKNNFPTSAIQSAVWVLSNNHKPSSIYTEDIASIYPLRKVIADIKGIEIPWYSLIYKTDTARLFSNKPEKIIGNFKYRVKNNSVITISIRDKKGNIVKKLVKEEAKGPGEYDLDINMNILKWPKGEYAIYVYQDYSKLIKRKKFIL